MPTEYTQKLIIFVTADKQADANAAAKTVDPEGGEFTFIHGLSPNGLLPITHYWCSWTMTGNEKNNLQARLSNVRPSNKVTVFDGNQVTPEQALAQMNLQPIIRPPLGT